MSNEISMIWTDSEVRIEGLETLDYLDNLCEKERFTEQGDALTFESEVNHYFQNLLNLLVKPNGPLMKSTFLDRWTELTLVLQVQ